MKDDIAFFRKKIHLVVEVSVGVRGPQGDLATDQDLRDALAGHLNGWSDGRGPFSAEVFKDGLQRSIVSSLGDAVSEEARRRFPGKTNLDGTNFSAAFADHKMSRLSNVHVLSEIDIVSVKTIP